MIFLPEGCDFIAESHKQSLELAENMNGPLMTKYRELAKACNIWVSVGGFHNKVWKWLNSNLQATFKLLESVL